jgi:hypothetical protein
MKRILVVCVAALLLASCATRTSFNSFYKEHKNKAAVTVSTPSFIANMLIPKDEISDYEALFAGVRHYRIMIFSEPDRSMEQSFDRFINRNRYDELFRVNSKGNNVGFFFLKQDAMINEMIMRVADGDSYVLIGLKTRLNEQEFNAIMESSNAEITVR